MPQLIGLSLTHDLRANLVRTIPHLRAFAISLCGNVDQADDLVQETILRGLSHLDRFEPGTNLQAWLFTILRNQFNTSFRKRRREVEDPDGINVGTVKSRMNRARARLAELLHVKDDDALGADRVIRAALAADAVRQGHWQRAA